MNLILSIIGLIVIYRLIVLVFWVCCWLALAPIRLVLGAIARWRKPTPTSNVIRFPSRHRN